ncbi:hypothetical protein MHA01_12270 [Marinococcus halophilus]|uniref:Uncharacterized protein n=1 Tax=Marinococcus halophilus TaxID=1371 RepID=A0A510Y4R1_MARHA|nr:hypothetical protein MHA01_12270 [Marinococcus halophilus]
MRIWDESHVKNNGHTKTYKFFANFMFYGEFPQRIKSSPKRYNYNSDLYLYKAW